MEFDITNMPEGYLQALLNAVVGNEKEKRIAKELLASVDPDRWAE